VVDLQAKASSPADRLAALAQRVGMSPAQHARELFDLAEPTATVLRGIEAGLFDTEASAETLFRAGTNLATDMVNIINNWQSATGERIKERPTGTVITAGSGQPLRVPVPGSPPGPPRQDFTPVPAGAGTANGHRG
jgi:transcriptional regulator with XRE-family HTH domain